MVEIYINGKLADLNDEQCVQFSIKTNFMGALDDIEASRTYTCTLPSTKRNMSIIGLANDISSVMGIRQKKLPANILLDGLEITKSATCFLTSVKESAFDIIIAWNTSNAFNKFGDDNLTDIIVNHPELYDYLSYQSIDTFEKPVAQIADEKGYFWYNNRLPDSDNTTVKYHHPCVSGKYIMDLIQSAYGVDIYNLSDVSANDYLFPLVTKKASMETMLYQGLSSTEDVWIPGSPLFILMPNNYSDHRADQIIDVFRPEGWTPSVNHSFYSNEYADSFRFQCHFKCTSANVLVFAAWDSDSHTIGETIITFGTDENNEFNLDETIKYKGDFRIYFLTNNVIEIDIDWVATTYFKITPLYEKTLFYDNANNSHRYGRFDILANLPNMKVSEFIADFCALNGLFPMCDSDRLTLMSYSQFMALETPLDWSDKFVSIKDVEYIHDKSAKAITFGMTTDDYSFDGSEVVTVDSDIVDDKNNYFDSVLTNMNGFLLPLYNKTINTDNEAEFELNDIAPKVGFKTVVNETWAGCTGISEATIFKPYFELQGLLITKYSKIADILKDYQLVTANMLLKPYDIYNFGLGKPIYIAKLGSYFAVTSIEYDTTNEISEVEMIKIN
jgi:hypothetical protein